MRKDIKQDIACSGPETEARFTVVLKFAEDGRKLLPAILAQSRNQVRKYQDFAGVHVWLQDKAYRYEYIAVMFVEAVST
mgnify:CR=1 FL=1